MKHHQIEKIEEPFNLGLFLGKLEQRMINWETHFSNHLSKHKWDRIINAIYWLSVVICFCYLKWSK